MQEAKLLLGYICGAITSGLSLYLGFYLAQRSLPQGENAKPLPSLFSFGAPRAQKRKPKAVSEEDLWKREQKMPPLDPGL
jgi:hypothetical protein